MSLFAFLSTWRDPWTLAIIGAACLCAGLAVWAPTLRIGRHTIRGYELAGTILLAAYSVAFAVVPNAGESPFTATFVFVLGYVALAAILAALGRLLKVPRIVVAILTVVAELGATLTLVNTGFWLSSFI